MNWDVFKKGLFWGCGLIVSVLLCIGIAWIGYSFLYKELVDSGLAYFATKFFPNRLEGSATSMTLNAETLYEATIAYYNQVISIMIFVAGFAGAIAFAHIGIISKRRAEEISESCVGKEVNRQFESHTFHERITNKIEDLLADSDFGLSAEQLELIKDRVEQLEQKYDRHDDLLQVRNERDLGNQEIENTLNSRGK